MTGRANPLWRKFNRWTPPGKQMATNANDGLREGLQMCLKRQRWRPLWRCLNTFQAKLKSPFLKWTEYYSSGSSTAWNKNRTDWYFTTLCSLQVPRLLLTVQRHTHVRLTGNSKLSVGANVNCECLSLSVSGTARIWLFVQAVTPPLTP